MNMLLYKSQIIQINLAQPTVAFPEWPVSYFPLKFCQGMETLSFWWQQLKSIHYTLIVAMKIHDHIERKDPLLKLLLKCPKFYLQLLGRKLKWTASRYPSLCSVSHIFQEK